MTTNIFSAAPYSATAAGFRAWGSAVKAGLAAVGMVNTADTGQIDWTTVTQSSAGSYSGYEIWRFNDALQATAPIYFKVEYGTGNTAAAPAVRLTIGKGSDGAGTITGMLLAATSVAASTGTLATYNWHVSSGDGSMLIVAPAVGLYDSASACWHFAIERSRDAAGAATGTALMVVTSASVITMKCINYAIGNTVTPPSFPATIPTAASTPGVAGGGNTPLFAGLCTDGLGTYWQPRSFFVGHSADIGQLTSLTVPGYGTYLFHTGFAMFTTMGSPYHCGAMAWY